jgi:hypothetical protein
VLHSNFCTFLGFRELKATKKQGLRGFEHKDKTILEGKESSESRCI